MTDPGLNRCVLDMQLWPLLFEDLTCIKFIFPGVVYLTHFRVEYEMVNLETSCFVVKKEHKVLFISTESHKNRINVKFSVVFLSFRCCFFNSAM